MSELRCVKCKRIVVIEDGQPVHIGDECGDNRKE